MIGDTLEKIAEEASRIECTYAKIYGIDCSGVRDCDTCRAWKRNHVLCRLHKVVDEGYTPLPTGKDGELIKPGHTYYGEDCMAWAIDAVGPVYCYGVDANKPGIAKRLRCKWLTKDATDSWDRIEVDSKRSATNYAYRYDIAGDDLASLMRAHLLKRCGQLIKETVR